MSAETDDNRPYRIMELLMELLMELYRIMELFW